MEEAAARETVEEAGVRGALEVRSPALCRLALRLCPQQVAATLQEGVACEHSGTAVPCIETRSGDCGGCGHAGGFRAASLPKLCCSSPGERLKPLLWESRVGKRQRCARPTLQVWAGIAFDSCACPLASLSLALRRLAIPVSGSGGFGARFSCFGAGALTYFTIKAFAAKCALL